MPRLEPIDLHFYQTCLFDQAPTPCLGMLENVFQSANASFNHLMHMSLHCVPITPTTIESLLCRCPQLQSLCLRFLHLDQDGWVPALTPLIASSVRYAYLSNLLFSTYNTGYKVLWSYAMRDGLALRERHPEVKVVRRSDDDPLGTGVGGVRR